MRISQWIFSSVLSCFLLVLCACGGSDSEGVQPADPAPSVFGLGASDTVNAIPLNPQQEPRSSPIQDPNATQLNPSECELDGVMSDMLSAVNRARSEGRFCGTDYLPEAAAVEWNCDLEQASQNHTEDMAMRGFISHQGSDGSNMSDRIDRVGYTYRYLSENIAAGYGSVEDVMSGWLSSEGHCRNIMNGAIEEMGAGYVFDENSSYQFFWTQVFATSLNE